MENRSESCSVQWTCALERGQVRKGAAAVPGSAQEAAQAAQGAAQGAAEALQQAAQRVQQTVEPQLREALGRATAQGATLKVTRTHIGALDGTEHAVAL